MRIANLDLGPAAVSRDRAAANEDQGDDADEDDADEDDEDEDDEDEDAADLRRDLHTYCGHCHAVPSPAVTARYRWKFIVDAMGRFSQEAGRPFAPRARARLLAYYESRAPTALPPLPVPDQPTGLRFRWDLLRDPAPRIADVRIVDLDGDGQREILVCDAAEGSVSRYRMDRRGAFHATPLVTGLPAPARAVPFDNDGDGDLDLVVAGLGRLLPTDDRVGYVALLINDGQHHFTSRRILADVGRVADVQPADLDGDGDIDFVVAIFGWLHTGGLVWLEQTAPGDFQSHRLFSFSGTVNVAITDLDHDGRPDFVALVSQAQEQIVAFLQTRQGRFMPTVLYDAGNPLFGSSGMQLVDLDQDGDQDVLFTNGDVFDARPELRPQNGIHYLENLGGLKFVHHRLARFYGAFSPKAGDLDGDGDLDVVASSFFNDWRDRRRPSVVWLENDGTQRFTMRPISNTPTDLPTVDVGDLDGDGRPDVVAGGMKAGRSEDLYGPPSRRARLSVWTNRGPRRP